MCETTIGTTLTTDMTPEGATRLGSAFNGFLPRMSDQIQPVPAVPPWPRCGASAIVFRGAEVLLVERAKGALKDAGASRQPHRAGRAGPAAAEREVRRRRRSVPASAAWVDVHEVLLNDAAGALAAHYVIAVFWGRWLEGEPVPASDAGGGAVVPICDIEEYPLTEGAAALIRRA